MALDSGAPLGTELVESSSTPVSDSTPSISDSSTPSTPSAVDLNDDTPIRWAGEKEPIRYGDLAKRLQADYTRKNQAFAKQQQEFQRQIEQQRKAVQDEQARIQSIAAELLRRQNGGGQQDEFLAQLTGKPYIDGQTAAALYRELKENGLGAVQQAIQERDKVSALLYQEVMNLRKELAGVKGTHVSQQFESKINNWLTEGGYPPEAKELAQEIYLAYEGDDLDNEFPVIFQKRWNQLQSIFLNQQKQKVESARKRPFSFPGKGGNGSANKQLGLKGHESPRETADFLWDMMNASEDDAT